MSTAPIEALPQERQQAILALLREHGRVVAADLAERFGVSEDSIRRDLRELAARGLCQRVYGGALKPSASPRALAARRELDSDAKRALAAAAAGLVQPGQVLLIDAGSTNACIAAALPEGRSLTVLTNAPDIAGLLLVREGIEVVLIGGRLDPQTGATVGAQALEQVQRVRADLCFPGACAIDTDGTLWANNAEEAVFKRAMVQASTETVVVATADKLAAHATHQVAAAAAVSRLVTGADAPTALLRRLRASGIEILKVPIGR
ncbi:DeoR/GlpR family DNA-binding transcription regulator [Xanthomonas sp. XNM01]|uniref:DeoR/GlpR family DNA-binding transcription regulator n=1 Tax=Xanthomonas sp. XNM01 TaxID=2769289 RepID=UPI00177B2699|nr:DeoR/GlpR family DNA-binding transcription regulator [Xanthomonas sp. XNM01]MBD9367736.1 DeoR/GlpR transcriptional regulator [Xanthomonas sp. XNM01]